MNSQLSNTLVKNSMPTPSPLNEGNVATPGYISNDPFNHYQHICNSCKMEKVEREIANGNVNPSASFSSSEPQPYDPSNHITHYLNVCFSAPDVLKCHLRPNNA